MTKTRAFAGMLAVVGLSACTGTLGESDFAPGAMQPGADPSAQGVAPRASRKDEGATVPGGASSPRPGQGAAGSEPQEEPRGIGTEVFALCDSGDERPAPRLLRLLTRDEYQRTLQDLLFLNATEDLNFAQLPLEARVLGYDNNARSQAVTSRHIDAYLELSSALVERAWQQSRGQIVSCDLQQSECGAQFIREFGRRAFRRPLSDEEVTRYRAMLVSMASSGADVERGAQVVIEAMLMSPHFLYRSEVGTVQGDGTYTLTPYEVASALAYQYWGTMPDEALFQAAEQGRLSTAQEREEQARRLLAAPQAEEQLYRFSLQWLGTYRVQDAFKDNTHFPEFSDGVREAMLEEQRRLFVQVVLRDKGSLRELYAPGYTFVNRALSDYYGMSVDSQEFSQQPVADGVRGGILGLGAVHAAHAHSNESSPIKRGVFVRRQLLCQALPPPPANLNTTPPGLDPSLTTRERFALHTEAAACAGCHQFIDGVGFGLEGFDGAGKWRDSEHGMPLDTSGELLGLNSLGSTDTHAFDGPAELGELIVNSDAGPACVALQYYRFARGYEERALDACSLQRLQQRFEESGQNLSELLVALAGLQSFVTRGEE